jgi:hypothetical protein
MHSQFLSDCYVQTQTDRRSVANRSIFASFRCELTEDQRRRNTFTKL